MYNWKEIKSEEDLPDESREEYLFYDKSNKSYHVLTSYDSNNIYACGSDEYDCIVWSDRPYYLDFGLTHWAELVPPGEKNVKMA